MAVQAVIDHVDPDVLLLAGIDWDHDLNALRALNDGLETPYAHLFSRRPNRGIWRGDDGDGDGRLGEPEDAEGYGPFPGYEGAAILSRFAFGSDVDDLSGTPWASLQGGLHGADRPPDQKLSTTMHWDVSVALPDGEVRFWTWHATAPVFDGSLDENGRRNRDEAQFWLNKLDEPTPVPVVLLGVANLDPHDGDGRPDALEGLLASPLLNDPKPSSEGGRAASDPGHRGDPALDTVAWPAPGPGNLRVDYVLPDARFRVLDAGVFWPAPGSADDASFGNQVRVASRHRLVWVDLVLQR